MNLFLPHPLLTLPTREQAREMERRFGKAAAARRIELLLRLRFKKMSQERLDPFTYGWESPIWHVVDQLLCDGKEVVLVNPAWDLGSPEEPGISKETREARLKLRREVPKDFLREAARRKKSGQGPLTLRGALECWISGSNRSSKSEYAGKKIMKLLFEAAERRTWCFADTEEVSIARQQPILWRYMPLEIRARIGTTGKLKEGITSRINWNGTNFVGNKFKLPNESQNWFKNYKQNPADMEGDQLDAIWLDELRDPELLRTLRVRLGDRNGLMIVTFTSIDDNYTAIVDEYDQGSKTILEVEAELLPIKKPRSEFETGLTGFSGLGNLSGGVESRRHARQSGFKLDAPNGTESVEASAYSDSGSSAPPAQIPQPNPQNPVNPVKTSRLVTVGYEKVPRVKVAGPGSDGNQRANICYFHITDNEYYGFSWNPKTAEKGKRTIFGSERFYRIWRNATRQKILSRVYGILGRSRLQQFRYNSAVHDIPLERVPRIGTRYHIVDPCPGRNWFMLWILIDPLGRWFVYREWPSYGHNEPSAYVPGIGDPGPWATPGGPRAGAGAGGRVAFDGSAGTAQLPFGFGLDRYKEEIFRLEGREENGDGRMPNAESERAPRRGGLTGGRRRARFPQAPEPEPEENAPEQIFERWMDSRYASSPTVLKEAPTTNILEMQKVGLDFRAAPSEQNITTRSDGSIEKLNTMLDYDDEVGPGEWSKRLQRFNEPRLFVADTCPNTRFALKEWTGRDGQHGACKDPADCLRYAALCGLDYISDDMFKWQGGGSYTRR